MKITSIILFAFLFAMLVSCGDIASKNNSGDIKSSLAVIGYKVIPQPFNNEVKATAELIANEQIELMAPLSGQVLDIYFKEGEDVTKGDPIIHIDDRNWKAQILGVKAELEVAQKDFERKKELLKIEGSSQEEVDHAFSVVETLKSQLQQLQLNIDLANVVAPFSGKLGMRNFSKGTYLKQGEIITTLTGLNQLKVDFMLAQEHQKNISIGKQIKVIIDNDTLLASIYAINPLINLQSRTINVRAMLQQNSGTLIMPGTFAEVLVSTNFVKEALLVPTQAVVPEMNNQTVYLYKNGKAVKKIIQMGNRTADKVQVLKGIIPGDTIITTGLLQVKEEMTLQLQSIN